MIRSQALVVEVWRCQTDEEWFRYLQSPIKVRNGYHWTLIRANYKKRSMVMVRGKEVK